MKKLITGFAAMAFTVVATVALAQTPAPPANDPIKRTPLQKTEYPEGHFTYVMMVEISPNSTIGRHTHPGIESSYVLDGNIDLVIEGKPPRRSRPATASRCRKTPCTAAKSATRGSGSLAS